MAVVAFRDASERGHFVGVAIVVVIGVPLIVLAPTKQSLEVIASRRVGRATISGFSKC